MIFWREQAFLTLPNYVFILPGFQLQVKIYGTKRKPDDLPSSKPIWSSFFLLSGVFNMYDIQY
jgi:uncharacterized membrane protein